MCTISRDASEGFLEQISPMLVQSIQPWRNVKRLEILGILMRILLAHLGEARDGEVRQMLAELTRGL